VALFGSVGGSVVRVDDSVFGSVDGSIVGSIGGSAVGGAVTVL